MSRADKIDQAISAHFFQQETTFRDIIRRLRSNDSMLTDVDLKAMRLTDHHVQELCQVLRNNTNLKSLDLSFNDGIGRLGVRALASCSCTSLKSLVMRHNKLSTMDMIELMRTRKFISLDMSHNEIAHDDDMPEFISVLEQNRQLDTLDLSYNKISEALAFALAHHPSLRRLTITDNQLSIPLAAIFSQSTHLKTLNLSGNRLGDVGAQYLSLNTTLSSLILDDNDITTAGAVPLFLNKTLTHLGLCHNSINSDIIRTIETNKSLISLHIKENSINSRVKKKITQVILGNRWENSLESLVERLYAASSAISNLAPGLNLDVFKVIMDYALPEMPSKTTIQKNIVDRAIGRYHRQFASRAEVISSEDIREPSFAP